MTIEKIKLGLPFLDDSVGGVYFGMPTLVKGTRNCGKNALAAQFANRVIRIGEKALVFCEAAPESVILEARSWGIELEQAVRSGQLLIVPLRDSRASGGGFPFDEAIAELNALVSRSSVGFAAFSTVIPWLAATPVADMPRRVDAFLAALAARSLTSLLLVHKPASTAAERLVDKLASDCPVVIEMEAFESAQRELRVVKFDGRDDLSLPLVFPLDLMPGKGLVQPAPVKADIPTPEPEAARRPAVPIGQRRHTLFGGADSPAAAPATASPTTPAASAKSAARPAAATRVAVTHQAMVTHHAAMAKHHATLFSSNPEPVAAAEQSAPAPARPEPAAPAAPAQAEPAATAPAQPANEPQPTNRSPRIRFSNVIR